MPYISKIYFKFFSNKDDLISSANQKTIDGFSVSLLNESEASLEKQVRQGWTTSEKFSIYSFSLPRYFGVFFNTNPPSGGSKILSDINVRQALSCSINKQELLQKIIDASKEKISAVNSPILPDYFGYSASTITYDFNTDAANKLLDKAGYKDTGDGQRAKANDKKPAFQFKSYLKIGSSGSEVTELQGCLARLDENFKTPLAG